MSTNTQINTIPLRNIISAEMIKLFSNPRIKISLGITMFFNLAFALLDAFRIPFYTIPDSPPSYISSFGIVMFFPIYFFLLLPILASSNEYKDGQFRVTLTAIPNRKKLMIGKMIAMIISVCLSISIVLIPARLIVGITNEVGAGNLMVDLGRWIAVYLLMSCISFGLAGFLRSSIITSSILILIPIFVATGILQWPAGLRFLPDQASMSLLGTPAYEVTALPVGIALTTLLIWSLLWIYIYWVTIQRRDS